MKYTSLLLAAGVVVARAAVVRTSVSNGKRSEGMSEFFSEDMRCTIEDASKAKKTINRPDPASIGIAWPNEELRAAAGVDAWGDWVPADGMTGYVAYGWRYAEAD